MSTDEGSEEGDSDNEELATRLEKMLDAQKGRNAKKLQRQGNAATVVAGATAAVSKQAEEAEDEEKERLALQRLLQGDDKSKDAKPDTSQSFAAHGMRKRYTLTFAVHDQVYNHDESL